jgi:MFS family permease
MGALSLYLTLFTYFPTFYKELFGESAGFWVSSAPALAMFAGIPASIVGIILTKKTGLRLPFIRYSGILLIPAILGMFMVKSPPVIVASAVLTGTCLFMWASPFFTIPQELPGMNAEKSGYLMGVFWALCYMAATFNVWFVGKIIEMTGNNYTAGFIYITVISCSLLAGSFTLPETGPGVKKEALPAVKSFWSKTGEIIRQAMVKKEALPAVKSLACFAPSFVIIQVCPRPSRGAKRRRSRRGNDLRPGTRAGRDWPLPG